MGTGGAGGLSVVAAGEGTAERPAAGGAADGGVAAAGGAPLAVNVADVVAQEAARGAPPPDSCGCSVAADIAAQLEAGCNVWEAVVATPEIQMFANMVS